MTKLQREIIMAKREVFHELCIPWDFKFEDKFVDDCAKFPSNDCESLLDIIVHDAIARDNKPAKYYYTLLRKHYPRADVLPYGRIVEICGNDGFDELVRTGFIKYNGRYMDSQMLYTI